MTTKTLNRRQARWAQELAGYDFRILFRPGKDNTEADYLSKRPEYRPEKGGDEGQGPILKPGNIQETPPGEEFTRYLGSGARICSILPAQWTNQFLEEVRLTAAEDPQYFALGTKPVSTTLKKHMLWVIGYPTRENSMATSPVAIGEQTGKFAIGRVAERLEEKVQRKTKERQREKKKKALHIA